MLTVIALSCDWRIGQQYLATKRGRNEALKLRGTKTEKN